MAVLILAEDVDATADAVVGALHERGATVHRLNTAWFPLQLDLSAELRDGRWTGSLRTVARTVDLDSVTAVWFRSPRAYRFPAAMSAAERAHANLEAKLGLGGVLASLPALWVNHPARLADAAYKPRQLALAARCGLAVPQTVITNEPATVRAFAAAGPTVGKVLGSNTIVEGGVRRIGFTRLLDGADLADLRGVELTAHLVQRWVDKDHEVRVTVIGDAVTAAAIHAGSPEGHVDFRADYPGLRYELVQPPDDVLRGVRRLMGALDLVYGALDFVVTPDGRWTFLEINAGGQFGFIEDATGAPLTAQLADLLAGASR